MCKQTAITFFKYLAIALFWLGVWWIAAAVIGKTVVLPYPHQVAATLGRLVITGAFWISTMLSLVRILAGYLLGLVLGVLFAVVAHRVRVVSDLLSPFVQIVRATPVASFILLLLVLMYRARIPTFICVLMVFPIVYTNVRTGLNGVDKQLAEVAQIYNFSLVKRTRLLYLPATAPYFISAARTALGLAWKAGIAAEVLCTTKQSIGQEIRDSQTYLLTEHLYAWTLVVIVLSLLLERGMLTLVAYLKRKYHIAEVRT